MSKVRPRMADRRNLILDAAISVIAKHGVRRLRLMAARTSFGVDVLCRPLRVRPST